MSLMLSLGRTHLAYTAFGSTISQTQSPIKEGTRMGYMLNRLDALSSTLISIHSQALLSVTTSI